MRHQHPATIHVLSSPVDLTSYVVDIRFFFLLAHITHGHLLDTILSIPIPPINTALQISYLGHFPSCVDY